MSDDGFIIEDQTADQANILPADPQTISIGDMSNDHATINQIQGLRDKFIRELIQNGKLPSSQEDRVILVKLMTDASGTALTRLRIKTDADKAKSEASVAASIADALSKYNPSIHPKRNTPIGASASIPVYTPKPGEAQVGVVPVTYQEIMGERPEPEK